MYCIFIISQRLEPACVVLRLRERLSLDVVPAVADLVRFGERYGDVIWHETALHEHPCLISDYMQYSYERSWRPFQNLDNLALATLAVGLLTCNRHTYLIAVQRSASLRRLHKDIVIFSLNYNECIPLAGHLHLSDHLRKNLLFPLAATFATIILFSTHNNSYLRALKPIFLFVRTSTYTGR